MPIAVHSAIAATPKGSDTPTWTDRDSYSVCLFLKLLQPFAAGRQTLNNIFRRFFTDSSPFFRELLYNGGVYPVRTAAQGRGERKPTAMKFLKRALPIVLAVCLLASLGAVSAIDAGETRTVIGADLTDEQIKTVYKTFGIERGSVKELTVTNQDERQYLSGVISDAQIGTKSISCISIEVLAAGKGMTVNTSHITYCTSQMYISALATAGITDAKITVTAPFDVSGTAALTGVYKAYEDITGTKLDETAKAVSSQELATTAELAQAIGDYDSVEIVNELKLILNETKDMTDAELRAKIREIAAEYNVTLTDDQMTQLVNLCRSLEKLDTNALLSKVQAVQDTLKQLAGAKEKVAAFTGKVKDVITAIGDFFDRVIAFFRK